MKLIKMICNIVAIVLITSIAIGFYALKVEPNISVIEEQGLHTNIEEPLKIVQISDVQINEHYTPDKFIKLVKKINEQKPDIFLFTGDLYDNYAQYGEEVRVIKALASIEAKYGKYAVWGNRDYGGGAVRRYEDILLKSGITLLENEGTEIVTEQGTRLFLAGVDDYLLGNQEIDQAVLGMSEADTYRILMTHEPDVADNYVDYGFDLIVAGHSHGGQVNIPFIDKMTTSMAEKYIKGMYELPTSEGTKLYVNSGIGTSRYPIRFLVPPEITVFTL